MCCCAELPERSVVKLEKTTDDWEDPTKNSKEEHFRLQGLLKQTVLALKGRQCVSTLKFWS